MEGWVQKLQSQFEALNAAAAARIEKQRNLLKSSLKQMPCGKCGTQTLDGDLVRFGCKKTHATTDRKHVMCFDCVADALERQGGFLERHAPRVLKDFPIFKEVILCYECHTPHCISRRVVFDTGFNQTQLKVAGRVHFSVNKSIGEALAGNFKVHVSKEQQTRRLLTKFKAIKGGERPRDEAPPDANSIWLENWTCDTNEGDPQGWLYGRDWKSAHEHAPSLLTFVRERRLYRTAVVLNEALQVCQVKPKVTDEAGTPATPAERSESPSFGSMPNTSSAALPPT